ncbi:hypothetical protein ACF1G0_21240 [Streptomyces sp. NPDC013953]|uniref:hypothetical protein n=1 Tax=Streptomyces sp. NPDC013953 TaxID=3364868 RepID=UPI0036F5FBF0
MSVLVVLNGEAGALVLAVILGIVALLLNICSAFTLEPAFHMWWLPERGITVMAVRTSPYGTSGDYTYTDAGGTSHSSYRQAYASEMRSATTRTTPAGRSAST